MEVENQAEIDQAVEEITYDENVYVSSKSTLLNLEAFLRIPVEELMRRYSINQKEMTIHRELKIDADSLYIFYKGVLLLNNCWWGKRASRLFVVKEKGIREWFVLAITPIKEQDEIVRELEYSTVKVFKSKYALDRWLKDPTKED